MPGIRVIASAVRRDMPGQVDYDKIAPTYDARYAGASYDGALAAMLRLVSAAGPEYTLEVGCGTGYWLSALHDLLPYRFGVDFSFNMLLKARQGSAGKLVRGGAESLP